MDTIIIRPNNTADQTEPTPYAIYRDGNIDGIASGIRHAWGITDLKNAKLAACQLNEADIPEAKLNATLKAYALDRSRCYVCDPETELDAGGDAGVRHKPADRHCIDPAHALYSAGYMVCVVDFIDKRLLNYPSTAQELSTSLAEYRDYLASIVGLIDEHNEQSR